MRTVFCSLLLVGVLVGMLGALAGCSVFGIATKGDLESRIERQDEDLARRLDAQSAALDNRLAAVSGRLVAMDRELDDAVDDLSDRSRRNEVAVTEVRTRFESIQGQLQLALADLASVAAAAERAEAGSRQALRIHRDTLVAERDRLQDRLRELDVQLAALEPGVPTVVSFDESHPALRVPGDER